MTKFLDDLLRFLLFYVSPVVILFIVLPPDSESIKYKFIAKECSQIKGNIVIGDSRPEIGFVDSTLQFTNLSLGGSTPLEGYETLMKLDLSLIDTAIISYSYYHLFTQDCFFRRALPSGFISKETEIEVKNMIKEFPKTSYHSNTNIDFESSFLDRYFYYKRNGLFRPNRLLNSLKFLFGLKIESINCSGGYGRTLNKASDLCNEEKITQELRHTYCPRDTAYFDSLNRVYLEKLLNSFHPKTKVYFIEWSRLRSAEDLSQTERANYLKEIQSLNENITVIGSLIDLGCDYFYDADHLNAKGAELYSNRIKEFIREK